MQVGTKEHWDVMHEFEKLYKIREPRYEKKEFWSMGYIYANGDINAKFIAFRHGYALGKLVGPTEAGEKKAGG